MGLKVYVREGESIALALRRFRKSTQIRLRRKSTQRSLVYHEKPGQVRRRKEFMKERYRYFWYWTCARAARGEI
jgi:ribosomal protein S21